MSAAIGAELTGTFGAIFATPVAGGYNVGDADEGFAQYFIKRISDTRHQVFNAIMLYDGTMAGCVDFIMCDIERLDTDRDAIKYEQYRTGSGLVFKRIDRISWDTWYGRDGVQMPYMAVWREDLGQYRVDMCGTVAYRETLEDVAEAIFDDWER